MSETLESLIERLGKLRRDLVGGDGGGIELCDDGYYVPYDDAEELVRAAARLSAPVPEQKWAPLLDPPDEERALYDAAEYVETGGMPSPDQHMRLCKVALKLAAAPVPARTRSLPDDWGALRNQGASPPHAAAEPEKPVAWNETMKRLDAAIAYKWERWASHFNRDDYVDFFRRESPSAQPIARDEQDAKRYRWLRDNWWTGREIMGTDPGMVKRWEALDARIDAALKSAGKEST